MEMNVEDLETLWSAWIGSKEMLIKGMERQKNFLGSEKHYRERFLRFANNYLKRDIKFTFKPDCGYLEIYVDGWYLTMIKGEKKPKGQISFIDSGNDIVLAVSDEKISKDTTFLVQEGENSPVEKYEYCTKIGRVSKHNISKEAWNVIKPHLYEELKQ